MKWSIASPYRLGASLATLAALTACDLLTPVGQLSSFSADSLSVVATSTVQFSASFATNLPNPLCSFDPFGDGRQVLFFQDCSSPLSFAFTYPQAGLFTPTLTLISNNTSSRRSLELAVLAPSNTPNQSPAAVPDSFSLPQNSTLTVNPPGVLTNDLLTAGYSAALVSRPRNAISFSLSPDGSFSYRPQATFSGLDSFSYQLRKGSLRTNSVSVSLLVDNPAANDPPIILLPTSFPSSPEDALLPLSGLQINDPDAANAPLLVSLSVNNGSLYMSSTSGLTFSPGRENGSRSPEFRASLPDLRTALTSLAYTPDPNWTGSDALSITVNDQGNSGPGAPRTDAKARSFTVTPVNDPPAISLPTATLAATPASSTPVSDLFITDIDAGSGSLKVTLAVNNGSLFMTALNGLRFASGKGNGKKLVEFTANLARTNAALASLSYSSIPNWTGSDTLSITINDQGNSGAGSPLSTSRTRPISVAVPPPTLDLSILKVEIGQSVIRETPSLIPGKQAYLFAYVLANEAGAVTTVVADVFHGSTRVGTVSLTAPTSLPTSSSNLDPTQTFSGYLPANYIAANLQIRVRVDPDNTRPETNENNNTYLLNPTLGSAIELPLTLVPITYKGVSALFPNFSPTLNNVWPVQKVSAVTRAGFTFTGDLSSFNSWSDMLNSVFAMRELDQSNNVAGNRRYYYGFVTYDAASPAAGMASIGWPTAVSFDDSYSWDTLNAMTHELGHNFGLLHAPCGNPPAVDASYPHTGGTLGTWGVVPDTTDPRTFTLISPNVYSTFMTYQYTDYMSYCWPKWVSDHNYDLVQDFLETNVPDPSRFQPPGKQLLISGRIVNGKVLLSPPVRYYGYPIRSRPGSYQLSLQGTVSRQRASFGTITSIAESGEMGRTEHGAQIPHESIPFEAYAQHFILSVADPGPVQQLEISLEEMALFARSARVITQADNLRVQTVQNTLRITWNAAAYPFASVFHISPQNERTTLSLWMEKGDQTVYLDGLAPGGRFEVQLSDGLSVVVR